MSKHEKSYLDSIAQLPCAACGDSPVHVHHPRTWAGAGQRSSHYLAIPLCPDCHQGDNGIHHNRKIFEMRYGTEVQLLAQTLEKLWKMR